MILKINWNNPIIKESDVLSIQPSDLDDFYKEADAYDKANIFFVLLTSLHYFVDKGSNEQAAHLCFLIAYYLFITYTPPGSCSLAMHYIKQAFSLNPLDVYLEWRSLIEKGN